MVHKIILLNRKWVTDTTFTVNWSIYNRNILEQDTLTLQGTMVYSILSITYNDIFEVIDALNYI